MGPAFSSVAVGSGPSEDGPAPAEVSAPAEAPDDAIPAEPPGSAADVPPPVDSSAVAPPPETAPAVPEATPPAEPTDTAAAVPDPGSEPAVEPIVEPSAPAPAPVDASMLDADNDSEAAAPVQTRPARAASEASPEERAASLDAAYASLYRPADNPLRLNVTARALFANVSNSNNAERVSGRMGGASVDIGPSWNRIGVAATLTGYGGRVQLPEGTGSQLNAMMGGGLTIGLGRLALMSRGFLDLRVGYDFYYGVVNQRSDVPAIVAPQDDSPDILATPTENLLPHGPRVRLDLGLLGSNSGRFFHGLGFSMGYQALIGSANGDLPMTNMLVLGLSYWMG